MTKVRLIILIVATTATLHVFAQRTIEGEVRLKDDNSALPGVNIIEKGTDTHVVTDAEGKFTIICRTADPVLIFSFVGLKTVEVDAGQDQQTVTMESDEDLMDDRTRMGIYPSFTSIGLNSGVRYTPIGVNVMNALPMLFGLKMLTTTNITYRTDLDKNKLFDFRMRKDRVIDSRYYNRYFNLEVYYGMRNITKETEMWEIEEVDLIGEVIFDLFVIRSGYGRQSMNDTETLKSNEGLILGLGKYFTWRGHVLVTTKKWSDYWQTECQFTKGFEDNDFEVGIRAETLDKYRELDLVIRYRIHY